MPLFRGTFAQVLAVALGALIWAPEVLAQDLPGRRDALRQVFEADAPIETVIFPDPSLSDAEVQLLSNAVTQGLLPDMVFYGAIAIAPDRGLADPQTTIAVGNFHDVEAASDAARARCDVARDGEGADCVLVMQVRPAGWAPGQPLQLSVGAVEALRGEFRSAGRPRVFSISPGTGNFGIGGDEGAANLACGAADCRPVVSDR